MLSPAKKMELMDIIVDYLPLFMFATLAIFLFTGYPVAFILGGVSILYGLIGFSLGKNYHTRTIPIRHDVP